MSFAKSLYWFARYRRGWGTAKPRNIVLELTRRCNLHCVYCPHDDLVPSKLPPIDMTEETFQKTVQWLKGAYNWASPVTISLQGLGEPLLDQRFLMRVDALRRSFGYARLALNTNGLLLHEALIDKVDAMVVSVNFTGEEAYLQYNGVDGLDAVTRRLQRFLKRKGDRKPDTAIQMLLLPENSPAEFALQWTSWLNGNDRLEFHAANGWTGELARFKNPNHYGGRHPCRQLWEKLYVSAEGNVYACCLGEVAYDDLKLGSVDEPLLELWRGWQLDALRWVQQNSRYSCSCRGCVVWHETAVPMVKVGKRWYG